MFQIFPRDPFFVDHVFVRDDCEGCGVLSRGVRPKARVGDVEFLVGVECGHDAVYGGGVAEDEGGGAGGVFVGGGNGEGAAGVEVVLDVDEEERCHDVVGAAIYEKSV